jgi:hypothetical protein
MLRIASLIVLTLTLTASPSFASQTRPDPCRKACAGWKPDCLKACKVGDTVAYKQREKRKVRCMASNTTGTGARECIARQRRIDMHGR